MSASENSDGMVASVVKSRDDELVGEWPGAETKLISERYSRRRDEFAKEGGGSASMQMLVSEMEIVSSAVVRSGQRPLRSARSGDKTYMVPAGAA